MRQSNKADSSRPRSTSRSFADSSRAADEQHNQAEVGESAIQQYMMSFQRAMYLQPAGD